MTADRRDWLRPEAAAARFQVCRRTLERWARRRWIGRSRVGHVAHYSGADIAALLAASAPPRQVVRVVEPEPESTPAPDRSWEDTGFWRQGGRR